MNLEDLRSDLAAFADDEQDVAIEETGTFMIIRNGQEMTGRLQVTPEGRSQVVLEDRVMDYRAFVTHELANLPVLAERLANRRPAVIGFVDGPVDVYRPAEEASIGRSLAILRQECEEPPAFAARISFITADAGHGKTALLRQYQAEQANLFLQGKSPYVFWHLDLQGRQLLRLSEALMGDLGDLRVTGLWMASLIRLMRHRALILAIDGFDELAAEQGGTDALGALASLVTQLGGRGSVVAAARRTFFDTEDYLRRAGVVGRALTSPCQFDQVSLRPWTRREVVEYFQQVTEGAEDSAQEAYEDILSQLGGEDTHPMLTRPFLVAQLARAVFDMQISPSAFMSTPDDPMSGVATVVRAFVEREVSDKWKFRDTGEPYLTVEQHMTLLADIAEEMYRSQKDRLGLDLIETIAALLLEQWKIEPSKRQQIIEMVRMHVLLVPPSDGDTSTRSFDHPEFRDYFLAYALRAHLERVMDGHPGFELARFLTIAQVTDSTARYVCNMIERDEVRVRTLVATLEELVANEWKPTFLQVNVGTLLPFVLNGVHFIGELTFSGRVIYTSLVFERTRLSNVTLARGAFVNASLAGVEWTDVTLSECNLGELAIDVETTFSNVLIRECVVDGLRIFDGEEEIREYAPERIWRRLEREGARLSDQEPLAFDDEGCADSAKVKVFRRLMRIFNRTTVASEHQMQQRFKHDAHILFDEVIPIMESHGLLSPRTWKGAGSMRIWGLEVRVEDILAAESGSNPKLSAFWSSLKQ